MARIQLVLPDEDRDRFVHQARREGVSLSEWLRLAAKERLARSEDQRPFRSAEEVQSFFAACDSVVEGEAPEPDWETHLETMRGSRSRGGSES